MAIVGDLLHDLGEGFYTSVTVDFKIDGNSYISFKEKNPLM